MGLMSSVAQNLTQATTSTFMPSQASCPYFSKIHQRPQIPVVNLIESDPDEVEPPAVPSSQERKMPIEPSEPAVIQAKVETPLNSNDSGPQSSQKSKQKIRLKGPFTLANFEKHLRQIWAKDPTLTDRQFFELAKRLFGMIQDENKILINITKKWTDRFYKMMRRQNYLEQTECTNIETSSSEVMVAEDGAFIFSEPESAEAEMTVENTSNIWKQHTIKLISERHPNKKIGRKSKFQPEEVKNIEDIWMVNTSMVKTLENRRFELSRLEQELSPENFTRRQSISFREENSSKKNKKRGRLPKQLPRID